MRVNDAIASPAPVKALHEAARRARLIPDADVAPAGATGADRSPPRTLESAEPASAAAGGSAGTKRHGNDSEEDEAFMAKRFRTAETLLLTPSPGSKAKSRSNAAAAASAEEDAEDFFSRRTSKRETSRPEHASDDDPDASMGSPTVVRRTPHSVVASPGVVELSDAETPTFNFSRVAAAVDASIAWLDDGVADGGSGDESGFGAGNPRAPWTMVHSLLRSIPTLAVAAATATHQTPAGGSVCGVRTLRTGGLGADPRLAAGTLRATVCVLTNLTNENPEGCAAVRAAGGLETAAALVPWCAALEGLLPGAGPDAEAREAAAARAGGARASAPKTSRRRGRIDASGKDSSAADAGHDMLNAALCFLVNIAEIDADARKTLRALEADAGAMERALRRPTPDGSEEEEDPSREFGETVAPGETRRDPRARSAKKSGTKKRAKKKQKIAAMNREITSRRVGLVELLAQIFVRSGGAGPVDERGNLMTPAAGDRRPGEKEPAEREDDGEVTAEMLKAREREGDGLITQAYAALLVAFLVEGQPALRADVQCTLPAGGFASLAAVLERFRAFHESLESISEESRASLKRVIRWLRGE
jgi:hypothetical protein